MCEQARPSVSLPFSFATHRAVPGPCADHIVCSHRPSHVDRRVCRGNAAAAGGQCPLPVPMKLCAIPVRPTWTTLDEDTSSPAGATTQPRGRPMAQPSRPQSGQEKEREDRWIKLACIHGIRSLFPMPAATFTHTKAWFSGNEIRRCPLADEGGCSFNEAQSAASFCAAARQCRIAEARGALLP